MNQRHLKPKEASSATIAFPEWLVWLGVIPLFSGVGAALGNILDVLNIPVPQGLGTDWTKLLGALLGAMGIGLFLSVLILG
jgi:hypothetical protein